jgi:putative ABC transport system permease protein
MRWITRAVSWIRSIARTRALERRLDEELRFHLEQQIEKNRRAGMPPEMARRLALLKFGGVERAREHTRGEIRPIVIDSVSHDLRDAARGIRRSPGFAAVAILLLAIGIGANTALFSIINAVLLQPLPYPDSTRLVWVGQTRADLPFSAEHPGAVSYRNFLDLREQQTVFAAVGAYQPANVSPGAFLINGEPVRMEIQRMSADTFAALNVTPVLGRVYTNDEDRPGASSWVVLSYRTWQERFGGRPVVGQPVSMNGVVHIILGVMPPGFSFPYDGIEAWLPIGFGVPSRAAHNLAAVARLKPGITLEQARAEVVTIASRLEQAHPDANTGWKGRVEPMKDVVVGDVGRPLWILFGAVSLVLLIACSNVANILLARASVRQQEMGVRVALGASRGRIVRQLLIESVLLSLVGCALGLLLARAGLTTFLALAGTAIPRAAEIALDGHVLTFTLVLAGLTGILFGLAPAWMSGDRTLHDLLQGAGGRGDTGSRTRMRQGLIVAEVALTLLLLTGAGLLLRSFERLQSVRDGFNSEHVVSVDLSIPGVKYRTSALQRQFFESLIEKLQAIPGVQDVGLTSRLPLKQKNGELLSYTVDGQIAAAGHPPDSMETLVASPGYFSTMGIPLQRGRLFTESDGAASAAVAIVDEEFVRRHWASVDPIGRRIRLDGPTAQELTVVGVVGRVKLGSLREQSEFVQAYVPARQRPGIHASVVVKSRLTPAALGGFVREQVRALDAAQPIHNLRTIAEIRERSLASERLSLSVLGVFAGVALALSVVGLYGVLAYSVARRRREIGVRTALGAQPADVRRLVLGQGLRLTALGIALGVAAAFVVTQSLASLLFEITPLDPVTFVAVSLVMLTVALTACWLPARRAARIDPILALRDG